MKAKVLACMPRSGLGNCLLVWARAKVFSEINELPLFVVGWNKIRVGPWIRGEIRKRYYGNMFRETTGFVSNLAIRIERRVFVLHSNIVTEPSLEYINKDDFPPIKLFEFNKIPDWPDRFHSIRQHRDMIRAAIYHMVRPSLLKRLYLYKPPVIGVHIRRGDLKDNARVPTMYFIKLINSIRSEAGACLPVTVFTDGTASEISPLLVLGNITLAPKDSDIIDLLLLARSKFIIPCPGSTFSNWSGFLSDAPIIMSPYIDSVRIRSVTVSADLYEGPLCDDKSIVPDVLKRQITRAAQDN
jgi:hypothetical protein